MALKKILEINNTGISGEYIKLNDVKFLPDGQLLIMLNIYGNQELRNLDKQPLSPISVTVNDLQLINQIKELLYNKVSSIPEFEGSENV